MLTSMFEVVVTLKHPSGSMVEWVGESMRLCPIKGNILTEMSRAGNHHKDYTVVRAHVNQFYIKD